jgi:hypothetical protein
MATLDQLVTATRTLSTRAAECIVCHVPVIVPDSPLATYGTLCDAAQTAAVIAEAEARREAGTRRLWEDICPPSMRATDPHKLPRPHLLQKVLSWTYGPKGLLLHGPTGTGKSRCAWRLLEREHNAGRRIAVVDSFSLSTELPAKFTVSCAAAEAWLARLVNVDLLLLDDVFKARLTDRAEESVFSVIDRRMNHGRPIIATTNDTGASLADRLTPDRAEPLLRRLREACTAISFTAP